jgi:ubiquinone/menaquinone biosynthesis C-methylase UbiE
MDYPLNVFKGTAEYYARFRPAYPQQLFDDIVQRFSLDTHGVLLDLGCGTGEMALPLARYFEKTFAWDPDPDMIRFGRQKAQDAGIDSIAFEQKSSHDLDTLTDTLRLVAMGQSFHWMDKPVVLRQLYDKLQSGGGVVIVNGGGIDKTPQNDLTSKKDAAVKEIVTRYLGPKRRAGNTFFVPPKEHYIDLLAQAGFQDVTETFYEYETTRSIDEIVGNLFSLSWASKAQFGDKAEEFDAEVRAALQKLSPSGTFEENVRFSCFMAVKS